MKDSITQQIIKLSRKERKPIMARVVKLAEEHGELAAAILREEGWKGMGKYTKETNHDNVLEEGCDVMIIVLSLLAKYKFTEDEIDEMMQKKLDKWLTTINKNNT